MQEAIEQDEYTLEKLADLTGKEGVHRFGPASEGEFNKARKAFFENCTMPFKKTQFAKNSENRIIAHANPL
jgi:hypothetical protein